MVRFVACVIAIGVCLAYGCSSSSEDAPSKPPPPSVPSGSGSAVAGGSPDSPLAKARRTAEAAARKAAMSAQRQELRSLLAGLSEEDMALLRAAKKECRQQSSGTDFYVRGTDGWLAVRSFQKTFCQEDPALGRAVAALRADPTAALSPWAGSEVDAIVHLDRQLKARGIDLVVTLQPFKMEVYPSRWLRHLPDGKLLFPELIPMALALLDADVEVVYLLPHFLAEARKTGAPLLFNGSRDMHWTAAGIALAARTIALRLERYAAVRERRAPGVVWRADDMGRVYRGKHLYQGELHSPVLIMGDSFTAIGPPYAGLHAQVAKEIGSPTTVLWVSGGAREIPRMLAEMGGQYLQGRRVVVWNIGSALFRMLHTTPIATPDLPVYDPSHPPGPQPPGQVQLYALVEEVSTVPDPAVVLYKDAVTVTKFRCFNIEKGSYSKYYLRGVQWVMKNRKLFPAAAKLAWGDHVRLVVRPFDEYAKEVRNIKTIRRSDDTTDLSLPLYWVDACTPIKSVKEAKPVKTTQGPVSPTPRRP